MSSLSPEFLIYLGNIGYNDSEFRSLSSSERGQVFFQFQQFKGLVLQQQQQQQPYSQQPPVQAWPLPSHQEEVLPQQEEIVPEQQVPREQLKPKSKKKKDYFANESLEVQQARARARQWFVTKCIPAQKAAAAARYQYEVENTLSKSESIRQQRENARNWAKHHLKNFIDEEEEDGGRL
jgi:hypothetical protein